jgi:hypothetical protein
MVSIGLFNSPNPEPSGTRKLSKSKSRGKIVLYAGVALASAVIGLLINLAINTPSAAWGASQSPIRQGLFYMNVILIFDIPAIMGILMFKGHPEWLAQPGKFVEGVKYSLLSPYALTGSAVIAAVAVVAGIPGPLNIDTVALVTAFAAVFFGPVVAFLGAFVGFILRYVLGLAPFVPNPTVMFGDALMDGGIWAVNATIFWFVIRGLKGTFKTVMTIVMAFVFMAIHFVGWGIVYYFTLNPYPAAVADFLFAVTPPTGFFVSSWVAQFFGVLVAAFYYDSRFLSATAAKLGIKTT